VDMTHDLDEDFHEASHESEVWWGVFVRNLSENIGEQSVMDLMTEEVISVRADDFLVRAARTMLTARVHRLPVLDGEHRILGIISMTDILRAFVEAAGHQESVGT